MDIITTVDATSKHMRAEDTEADRLDIDPTDRIWLSVWRHHHWEQTPLDISQFQNKNQFQNKTKSRNKATDGDRWPN